MKTSFENTPFLLHFLPLDFYFLVSLSGKVYGLRSSVEGILFLVSYNILICFCILVMKYGFIGIVEFGTSYKLNILSYLLIELGCGILLWQMLSPF